MSVSLYGQDDILITDKRIHLRLVLLYEGGQTVPKQEILKINHDSKLFIDETGPAILKFRIDEVSRSHQRQLFCIQVSADTSHYPLTSDVSPDMCLPIEVRSKRNNARVRDRSGGEMDLPPAKLQSKETLS